MLKFLNKILGDPNEKEVKRLFPLVERIQKEEEKLKNLSEDEFKSKTEEFKTRLQKGETIDDLLVEAFAVVKNACKRLQGQKFSLGSGEITWEMVPYDVQLIGGIVLHQGKISEMKTGEGKTLVAVLPVYLNALLGKGVHVVTVNDYLAKRDAAWMGILYSYLGLSVGTIVHGISREERKAAYAADITYGTNNEFGFDYLRDNMATRNEDIVQRLELHYAIVDEVDSILIDEARTPLIISSPAEESTEKYRQYAFLVHQLQENEHYSIDEKMKTAVLTEEGVQKMEELLGVANIYTEKGFVEVHHIEQSLRAHTVYKRDVDYVVNEGEVVIVDEFTGRLMPGRRYSEGLHQAIEAKENVEVKRESKTLATITFQNYFRLYKKLAGMTGTAYTEAEEFSRIYKLEVVVIPTNMPVVRKDLPDMIYKNEHGKFMAITEKVKEKYKNGQPVLIGTISIEKSEILSKMLEQEKIPHTVLNAKHHEKESMIVAKAGQKGSVTIATNMAGRGTDIKLGEGVSELGGLTILGSERHEARRIDNQLRGRSGRQGDPGESQFFISLGDSLMRLFGSEKLQKVMEWANIPDDMPIENKFVSNAIESAQKKVEGHHFDIRKHVVEYDDVMSKHREIIYSRRRKVLFNEDLRGEILEMIREEVNILVENHTSGRSHEEWSLKEIVESVHALYHREERHVRLEDIEKFILADELKAFLYEFLLSVYSEREKSLPNAEIMRDVERSIYLRSIDTLWMEHIDAMSYLRQNVALRGYGQRDPLMEYKAEAFRMFQELLAKIRSGTVITLFKINIEVRDKPVIAPETPKIEDLETNEDQIEGNITGTPSGSKTIKAGGTIRNVESVGRNDPCPCGSGKKYKKCHGQ
ncbi:preprotein translocase subunit SecA [Candidatus Peregrinibacteria bacterium]|nr:preprotein translocase subunit SecA [Candidatus Peregrinibacteria bacterium]